MNQSAQSKLLLVNASPNQADVMRLQLAQVGCQVVSTKAGESSFEVVQREHPDLVICCLTLRHSLELCHLIREHPDLRGTPILLVSAAPSEAEALTTLVDDYLYAPYESVHLIAKAARLLERQQAAKTLKRNEERFRTLIENSLDIISVLGPDAICRYESPSVTQALGYQPEELVGKSIFAFIHPEDVPRVQEVFHCAFEQVGVSQQIDYRFRHKNGSWYVFESIGKTFVEESGELCVVVNSRDVTERKRAEERLREYEKCVEGLEELLVVIDRDYRYLLANRAYLNYRRLTREQLVGRLAADLLDPGIFEQVIKKKLDECLEGKVIKYEMRYNYPQLGERDLFIQYFPIEGPNGVDRVACVLQDITERKRAEAHLAYQANLLANVHNAILATDEHFSLTAWNRAAEELYGWRGEEVMGRQVREVIRPEFTDDQRAEAIKGLTETGRYQTEVVHHRRDGTPLFVQGYTIALRDEVGRITGYVSANRDLTERKRAEEQLKQRERQLAEAQRLAHIGSWGWDITNNIVTWSDELYRIFGISQQDFKGTLDAVLELVNSDERDFVISTIENSLKNQEPLDFYLHITRPDGEMRILHSCGDIECGEQGNPIRMFGTAQDITERHLAEEQLKSSNERLRALSARLQSVREEESFRIAHEIHDELGGALTGLKMDLLWLAKRLPQAEDGAIHHRLKSMADYIDETMQKVRNIATELRPSVLDDLGLASAIKWLAREFQKRTEIECKIVADPAEVTLSAEKSTAVFRILQEILTNVARHANATHVVIWVAEQAQDFVLKVSDNGKGISDRDISNTKSLGLIGMRERAILFGGWVEITGAAGKGTTVTLSIPRN